MPIITYYIDVTCYVCQYRPKIKKRPDYVKKGIKASSSFLKLMEKEWQTWSSWPDTGLERSPKKTLRLDPCLGIAYGSRDNSKSALADSDIGKWFSDYVDLTDVKELPSCSPDTGRLPEAQQPMSTSGKTKPRWTVRDSNSFKS